MRPSIRKTSEAPNPQVNPRLYLLYLVIVICMLMLMGGLGYRQLVQEEAFSAAAERQNYRRILMPGPRGIIYDRHGRVLVGNRPLFSAVVYLNELRREFRAEYYNLVRWNRERGLNPDRFQLNTEARRRVVQRYMSRINSLIGTDKDVDSKDIERHFSQSLLLPFPLIKDLPSEAYAKLIEQISIDSPIQIISGTARWYPYGEAAAHSLGFVSDSTEFPEGTLPGDTLLTFRNEGQIGRSGLEKQFNSELQGLTGGEIWTVDPSGFQYERVVHEQPRKGTDLTTSLDIDVQLAAEAALGDKTGAVVAIEIETGEVLAIVSKPAYDLNDLSPFISFKVDKEIREKGAWLNRATQGLYPPGSTFKLITAIAGLRTGTINPETVIDCQGFHMVGRRIFHCHRRSGHGEESLVEAIRDSCNVFFYNRGTETGIWGIANEARRFHLDQRTGIELPGETGRMLVPDPEWKAARFYGEGWFEGDTANVSIGQGFLLLTPMQMATFAASLARETTFLHPTLLHAKREAITDGPIGLPADRLALIKEGMRQAGERGTARLAGNPMLPVAGKTGTAQVRKDGKPTTLAWFVGYAPVQNPRIAVAVLVEGVPNQETEYGGGSTAAPIAKEVFQQFIHEGQ
ncbi:penicillin-binding protein 2 [Puniceicoccales bacterium CK1056]|uniref:Penicillin-binding protein 2 n=1 Tax=Oceanipulchritudo coccoides TaxID=2706888 RepID=A0A6B2LZ60_9BACT|nr:penicillin-binding protein 2 [Oceanipulchritudo coccoides]NDV61224.1 penicillin-binding protein 2 [Oceanipulchritudo coccoides]